MDCLMKVHVGCGKTHLAVAIATFGLNSLVNRSFLSRRQTCLICCVPVWCTQVATSYDEYFRTHSQTFRYLCLMTWRVENPSAWAKEKTFQLLNYRHVNNLAHCHNNQHRRWTNLDPMP